MAKAEQKGYNILIELLNKGILVQSEKIFNGYEVTVWPKGFKDNDHHHFQGETLLEALCKIKL